MRLNKLTQALQQEPWPRLAREAAWRTMRSTRKAAFRVAAQGRKHPVSFRPIGYYSLDKGAVAPQAREHLVAYADAVVGGRYPLLGYGSPALGTHPDWQRDWVSGKGWPLAPSRRLCVVRHDGSDVKAPWELSRLQWSPVVARAWALTGDTRYRTILQSLLTDWIVNNPPGIGVNWTVAMEAALRGISLCLTMELLWPFAKEERPWVELLEKSLWQHLRFIETHNEFSWLVRSNHYLSNLTGLTTLSAYLEGRGMKRRCERYACALQQEILLQTYPDGGNREASTGYHVLVAQMGLHTLRVQKQAGSAIAPAFEDRLHLMLEWIAELADDRGTLPLVGDCDNGRVELLAEDIAQAGLDTIHRHALRVGGLFAEKNPAPADRGKPDPLSNLPDSGIAVLRSSDASVVFYAMPNGLGGKGSHTHCDKLSFILRLRTNSGSCDVFCDPGSRTYTRSATQRNRDRSTEAHNTLTVNGTDQNTISPLPEHLFSAGNEAAVSPIAELSREPVSVRASHQGYARFGIGHTRTLQLCDDSLQLIDELTGPSESYQLDLNFTVGPEWHISSERMEGNTVSCCITGPRTVKLVCESAGSLRLTISLAEIAREYGAALPARTIKIRTTAKLPATLRTTVNWK